MKAVSLIVKIVRVCLLFSMLVFASVGQASEYERRIEFPAIHIELKRLLEILSSADKMIERANKGAEPEGKTDVATIDESHSLELGYRGQTWTFDKFDISLVNSSVPPVLTSIEARYSGGFHSGKISSFSLSLSDYSRSLRVQGANPLEVDPIVNHLSSTLTESSTIFGGNGFRSVIYAVFYLVGMLFIMSGLTYPHATKKLRAVLIGIPAVMVLTTFFAPLDEWLAGTLVQTGETSWIRRNAAEIGMAGFVLSILFGLWPMISNSSWFTSPQTAATEDQQPANTGKRRRSGK